MYINIYKTRLMMKNQLVRLWRLSSPTVSICKPKTQESQGVDSLIWKPENQGS